MATQINLTAAIAVLALAIVAYSFFNSENPINTNAVYGTPASSFCDDIDGINVHFQANCTDARGTFVEVCNSANSGAVNEYYCAPNNICQSRKIRCGYKETCVDGACVPF